MAAWLLVLVAVSACQGSTRFTTHFGQQAVELARHVPRCTQIQPREFPHMDNPNASGATCFIDGYPVTFFAWLAPGEGGLPPQTMTFAFAAGRTWAATIDGADLQVQRRIAGEVAKALGGKVATG